MVHFVSVHEILQNTKRTTGPLIVKKRGGSVVKTLG